jgi:signal transduction histidine kinase
MQVAQWALKTMTLKGYRVSLMSVLIALLLSCAFWPWLLPDPLPIFLAAVTLSASHGGWRSAVLAAVFSALAIDYFFIPPLHTLNLNRETIFNSLPFVMVALLVRGIEDARRKDVEEQEHRLSLERKARQDAEIASRRKDDLLAMVAHELRTPLGVILGWTRVLQNKGLDRSTVDHALGFVARNAELQERLVNDLLDMSRMLNGKLRVDLRPAEIVPIVEQSIEDVARAAGEKGIKVETDVVEPLTVQGDPERLQQVFWNLLSNAVKFTPTGGVIRVCLERESALARIAVSDTGRGIAPEFLPHIFDSYEQEGRQCLSRESGLGLGLAIVRLIVEMHRGSVKAESAGPGTGATFIVYLPIADFD